MNKAFLNIVLYILGALAISFLGFIGLALQYNGLWKLNAYGLLMKCNFGIVKVYQVTDSTMARMRDYDGVIFNKHLICGLGKLELLKNGGSLNFIDNGSQTIYAAEKVEKNFLEEKKRVADDPRDQFLMFYEAFKENYAFFDLYQVNFDETYQRYSQIIDENTDDDTLFLYMSELISGLNDDHIYLDAEDKTFSPYKNPSAFWGDTEKVQELVNLIKTKYLTDFIKFTDSPVRYAILKEEIGYIILSGMGTETINQVKTTKKAFDQIIAKFQHKKTIVIDIRFNGGGFDAASLAINGYFTQTPYLAYKKQACYKGNFTEPQEIYVYPNGLYYDGDIILLTSKYTVSAAETFGQALVANPNIKIVVVGEETKGFYSDCIPRKIKENWYFGLSNERYLSANDIDLEGTSVNPDVIIPVQYSDVQKGIDPMIEWVLNEF